MEEISEIPQTASECDACLKNVNAADVFCGNCGYPLTACMLELYSIQ